MVDRKSPGAVAPSRDPREIAARALARRDRSERDLSERLGGAGVPPDECETTVEWLRSLGYVDDARLARRRAEALAERGYGDVEIAARLESEGIEIADRAAALAALDPEHERARRLAAATGEEPRRLGVLLARRGFSDETIEAVVGPLDA